MKLDKHTEYITNLISKGEHQQQDFKFAINDTRKIAKTLVAFANTDGGTLLLGVKDNGVIVGVKSDEEIYMIESAASLYSKPAVSFSAKQWSVNGRMVVETIIPKSIEMPHFAQDYDGKWLAYIRQHDENFLVNNVWLRVIERKNSKEGAQFIFSHKERFLLNYLEEEDRINFAKFCKLAHVPYQIAEDILVNFIVWDLIEMVFDKGKIFYKLKEKKK